MLEYIIDHYQPIIALLGSLTGLLGISTTIYSKHKDAQLKEKQFELEKMHQISQETYQKIFDQKLLLYKDLQIKLQTYKDRLHDIGIEVFYGNREPEVINEEDVAIESFLEITKLIKEGIFFVSEDLEQQFRQIHNHYKETLFDFEADRQLGVYRHLDENIEQEIEESQLSHYNKVFFEKHKKDVNALFEIIENEIKQIKKDIGFL